jgi:hypothetical protein
MSLNALVPCSLPAARAAGAAPGIELGACEYSGLNSTSKYDVLFGTVTLAVGTATLNIASILGNDATNTIPVARNNACVFEGWQGSATGAAVAGALAANSGAGYVGRLVIGGVAPAQTNTLTISAINADGSILNTSTAVVGFRLYVPKPGFY